MDKPSIILEWITASEAVFTQLENCSKSEPLTQPHKFWKKSTNIVTREGGQMITTSSNLDQELWKTKTRCYSQESPTAKKTWKSSVVKGNRLKQSQQAKDGTKRPVVIRQWKVPDPQDWK